MKGIYHKNFGDGTDRQHIHSNANFHRGTWKTYLEKKRQYLKKGY